MADEEEFNVKCSVYNFGNCGPKCGLSARTPKEVQCKGLAGFANATSSHLRYLKTSALGIETEWQLILARVGQFQLVSECPPDLTICPRHRTELGLYWTRRARSHCYHPQHKPSSKSKPDRGIGLELSREIFEDEGVLVPVGSGICKMCRLLPKRQKQETMTEPEPEPEPEMEVQETAEFGAQAHLDQPALSTSPVLGSQSEPLSVPVGDECEEQSSSTESLVPTGSSSSNEQELSLWIPTPAPKLPYLNSFIRSVSDGTVTPVRGQLLVPLYDAADSTRRYYKRKANQVIDLALECIAPGQCEQLKVTLQTAQSDSSVEETVQLLYNSCDSWFTRRQILSVFVNSFTKEKLKEILPGLTTHRIDEARRHAALIGPGQLVEQKTVQKSRLDLTKVDHFIDFLSNPLFLQDVAYGTRNLKLSTGEKIEVPNVVRTVIVSRLVRLYQSYCEETMYTPLGRSTLFDIAQKCSASQKKSVSGLDNIVADGVDGFDTLEKLTSKLQQYGKSKDWLEVIQSTLRTCKRYMKTDFVVHLSSTSLIPDHCLPFALSTDEACFSAVCEHAHDHRCGHCNMLFEVLAEIEGVFQGSVQDCDEIEEMRFELDKAKANIEKWKSHIVRAVQQDKCKSDLLDTLSPSQALITMDWAMKYLPVSFRETQEDWFGKKGKSWHVSAVITRSDGDFKVLCFVHIFEQVVQDWFAVASLVEDTLRKLPSFLPEVTEVFVRSDNAGCYHSSQLLLCLPAMSERVNIKVARYDFSEPQRGKDICDRKIAVLKSHIRRFVNEGNDVKTASDMKRAIESYGGVTSCVASVVKLSVNTKKSSKQTWSGVQSYTNFQYEANGLRVWKGYNIGPGLLIPHSKLTSYGMMQGSTDLVTVEDFTSDTCPTTVSTRSRVAKEATESVSEPLQQSAGFSCPESNCAKVFTTFSGLQKHLDSGRHMYVEQERNVSDYVKSKWAEICSSVSTGSARSLEGSSSVGTSHASRGWASRGPRKATRLKQGVKDYLSEIFREGERSGLKANPEQVVKNMRKVSKFSREDWLTASQVKSQFSRLAALQRAGKLTLLDSNEIDCVVAEDQHYNTRRKVCESLDL